jgi:type VI secretion system secreted protein Hcp
MGGTKFLLTMETQTQGKITGSSTKSKGSVDYGKGLECLAFEYGVESQFDAASGLPTGKRTHKPITITREVDQASPKLWSALCTNEVFKSVVLQFNKPSTGGKEVVAERITLTNAVISGVRRFTPSPGKRGEALTLTYEELEVNGLKNSHIPYYLLKG